MMVILRDMACVRFLQPQGDTTVNHFIFPHRDTHTRPYKIRGVCVSLSSDQHDPHT